MPSVPQLAQTLRLILSQGRFAAPETASDESQCVSAGFLGSAIKELLKNAAVAAPGNSTAPIQRYQVLSELSGGIYKSAAVGELGWLTYFGYRAVILPFQDFENAVIGRIYKVCLPDGRAKQHEFWIVWKKAV